MSSHLSKQQRTYPPSDGSYPKLATVRHLGRGPSRAPAPRRGPDDRRFLNEARIALVRTRAVPRPQLEKRSLVARLFRRRSG